MNKILKLLAVVLIAVSCNKNENNEISWPGEYTNQYVSTLTGFEERKEVVLDILNVSYTDFVSLSTSPAWELSESKQTTLKSIRDGMDEADENTLLQKVIALEDISTYMNNKYGGTIGGFVSIAADVKNLQNMYDVYWGLRLDYDDTLFSDSGAGYAVLRFYSDAANLLTIPYCEELGGNYPHSWPCGGGGFTTSTLGEGGYPEFKFDGYYAPVEGAELYEVSTNGYQILRAVFEDGAWQSCDVGLEPTVTKTTVDSGVKNGLYYDENGAKVYKQTLCTYKGKTFNVRGVIDGIYHITSSTNYPDLQLSVIERGVWGCEVDSSEIENVWVEQVQ